MKSNKLNLLQEAIALARKNDWDKAHQLVQQYEGDPDFDSIHALLHRQEGDRFNTQWWYNKLGKKIPDIGIEEELDELENRFTKIYAGQAKNEAN